MWKEETFDDFALGVGGETPEHRVARLEKKSIISSFITEHQELFSGEVTLECDGCVLWNGTFIGAITVTDVEEGLFSVNNRINTLIEEACSCGAFE